MTAAVFLNSQAMPASSSPPGPIPAQLGLKAWTVPIQDCTSGLAGGLPMAAGNFLATLIRPGPALITNLGLWVTTVATAPSTGVNKMGLYTEAGVLIDETADMAAEFATLGYQKKALALGPYQTAADTSYWVTGLAHMTVAGRIGGVDDNLMGNYPVVNGHYTSVFVAAQATNPASFNPVTASKNSASYFYGMD